MTTLTAADYADTGQWRLIIKIFTTGISALLENTLHDDVEPQPLFSSKWDDSEGDILRNIENAVYDHPRVLDDFSARIEVFDRRTLFLPTALLEETEGIEDTFYTSVYDADERDVMCQTDKDITAAFTLTKGLKAFLVRTFPGARIVCNLMQQVKAQRASGDGKRMWISAREKEADFVLTDGRDLISASTHSISSPDDILYHAFNIMGVYGIAPAEVAVEGIGIPEETTGILRKFTNSDNDKKQ